MGIACFEFRGLIPSAGRPAYNWKQEGSDVARIGRGSLVELVQSLSNCGPIAEFGGKTSVCKQIWKALALRKRNQLLALKSCSSERSQNQRDVRRHHATSKLVIISLPFRGPIAGLSRLALYQSRCSTSYIAMHKF